MGAYNNPVILPKQQNPWENALPTLLTNLALAKIQHNWAMDVKDKELEAAQIAAQTEREHEKSLVGARGKEARKTAFTTAQTQGKIQPAQGPYRDAFQGEQGGWWQARPDAYTLGPGERRMRGGEVVAEGGQKIPTTAWQGFFQQNPNASVEQIVNFAQAQKGKGTSMTFNPDTGEFTFEQGGPQGGMTKKTQGKAQEEYMKASSGLQRVLGVAKDYDSRYLQYKPRLNAVWTAFKEKAGFEPSKQDRKFLRDFSEFRRGAIENINKYIKEITGAQMSEAEAARLMKAMPNAGQGIFDGDSPTEFKSKLDSVTEKLKRAKARYSYIDNYGLKLKDVNLDEMPEIMGKRENELRQLIKRKNPNIPPQKLKELVRQQLSNEFGL